MQKIREAIKNEPSVFLFKKMWQFSKGSHGTVALSIFLGTISQVILLAEPLIFAEFLNEMQKNGLENLEYILLILSSFVVLTVFFWAFHSSARILEERLSFSVGVTYLHYMFSNILKLGLRWHGDRDSGDTIDKVNKAKNSLEEFSHTITTFARVFVRLFGTVAVLLVFNIYVGLFALVFTIFSIGILLMFDKHLVPKYKQLNKYSNHVSAGVFDALSNVSSVIILHIEKAIIKGIDKRMQKPWETFKSKATLMEIKWFTGDLLFTLLTVIPLFMYLVFISKQGTIIEIGTISALYLYLSRMSSVFFTLANLYGNTAMRHANVENAEEIEESIEKNIKIQQKKIKIKDWQEIEVKNLNFSYIGSKVEQKDLHLDNVNITIKKGERIAFIGESGSGKTTFLKVLHGLYDSASAKLTFTDNSLIKSGIEVDERVEDTSRQGTSGDMRTSFNSIDLATMLVPQEPEIFSATIKENITLGLSTKSDEIDKVLALARFTDVVTKLPNGLKSVINEKGVNLSGGQKQRLALARALLFAKDKQILLLDESTSSVDPENEAHIYEDIFKEYSDKTILASIHKMNLLKYFDRIVMFEEGRIVDMGSFDELLKKNKKFKQEWEAFVRSNV